MAGTVTFGGIGSGIDTESLIAGLVSVERTGQNAMKQQVSASQSSLSNLSNVSSLLARLKSASDALDTSSEVGSYKATSSSTSVVASANGLARPGSYTISVDKLAKEQRTYSNSVGSSSSTALGQSGTLAIGVGTGTASNIAIASTDTLDDVIGKINGAGLRVNASAFFDGTNFRIQLRGMDTGAANALSISETGTTLGFNATGNTFQAAQNASIKVDNFTVTSGTNQVVGAIQGVTLALTAETTSPTTVTIDSDSGSLSTKLRTLVDAYNSVVSTVHTLAGSGSVTASDPGLAGDGTLRSLTSRMTSALQTVVSGTGQYSTLGSIGLSLDRGGKLSFDSTKFDKAVQADSASVTKLLSGSDAAAGSGVMDIVSGVLDSFTRPDTGLLVQRKTTFDNRIKSLNDRIDREDTRINRYSDQLRKQFTNMDTLVASYNSQSSYLSQL